MRTPSCLLVALGAAVAAATACDRPRAFAQPPASEYTAMRLELAAHPTALLSWTLWQRRFGSAPTIIGTTIRLNGNDAVVLGVVPKEFNIPAGAEVWIPRR